MTDGGGGASALYTSLLTMTKSFLAGTLSGIVGKVIEYPLDTVKVRLQMQKFAGDATMKFSGPVDVVRETIRVEGVRGLYRGVGSPIVGAMGENVACFVLYDQVKLALARRSEEKDVNRVPMWGVAVAGASAGLGTTLVLTPVELVKVRLQMQRSSGADARYRGVVHAVGDIFATEGLRGFLRGASATMMRELPGNAIWFSTYEGLTRLMMTADEQRGDVGAARTILAGGCAGSLYWAIPYPIDTIKSYMQVKGESVKFSEAARLIYRHSGVGGFYQGAGVTVLRAFPSNAVVFLVYERLSRLFAL